jgi:hypothetical protein
VAGHAFLLEGILFLSLVSVPGDFSSAPKRVPCRGSRPGCIIRVLRGIGKAGNSLTNTDKWLDNIQENAVIYQNNSIINK